MLQNPPVMIERGEEYEASCGARRGIPDRHGEVSMSHFGGAPPPRGKLEPLRDDARDKPNRPAKMQGRFDLSQNGYGSLHRYMYERVC